MIHSFSENDLHLIKCEMIALETNEDAVLQSLYEISAEDKKKDTYDAINDFINIDVITQEIINMKITMENIEKYNKTMIELKNIYVRDAITLNVSSWTPESGEVTSSTTIVTYINKQTRKQLLHPRTNIRIQYENDINEFDFNLCGVYID